MELLRLTAAAEGGVWGGVMPATILTYENVVPVAALPMWRS